MEHLGHLHPYLFSPSSTNLRAVLVRRGAHGLPPHRYAMTLKRRSPGDMQAPNAVPEADWSRRSTSSWLSRAPPLLVWTAGSARTQWTRGPPHSLAHRGRRCLRSHASAGIQIECMRYCAYCAPPPTSDSQYQCARPASTTLVCANSRRRATFEADSPRRHGVCARVYCARAQARSISAGTCGPTTAHSASRTRARLATRSSARSGQKLATLTGFAKHLLEEEPSHRAQQRPPAATRRSSIAVPAT